MNHIRTIIKAHDDRVAAAVPAWLAQYAAQLAVLVLMRMLVVIYGEMFSLYKEEFKGAKEFYAEVGRHTGRAFAERDFVKFLKAMGDTVKTAQRNKLVRHTRYAQRVANGILRYFKVTAIRDAATVAMAMLIGAAIGKLVPYLHTRGRAGVLEDVVKAAKKLGQVGETVSSAAEVGGTIKKTLAQLNHTDEEWERAMAELEAASPPLAAK